MEVIASVLLYLQVLKLSLPLFLFKTAPETKRVLSLSDGCFMSCFANCHLSFREEVSEGEFVFFSVGLLD